MKIARFQEEHVDILKILKRIETYCHQDIVLQSDNLSRELLMLRFKVKVHLSIEDKILYPAINEVSNQRVAELANNFRKEMMDITNVFLRYIERWKVAASIRQQPAAFLAETQKIIEALRHRIQHENVEFYPVIEKAYAQAV